MHKLPSENDNLAHLKTSKTASLLATIPPPALILLAVISIQVGAGVATSLFPVLGAEGAVAIRILFSALLFLLLMRKRLRIFYQAFINNTKLLLGYGCCIAAMNLFFYKSIALIPLGAAVAIEFIGPLGVAAISSRRPGHFAWVALAAVGIVLLSPISGVDLDPHGIIFALMAGTGWSLFIILTGRVSRRIPGHDGLVIGMTIAATVMIPLAVPVMGYLAVDPRVLLGCLAVAILSTALPFTLEFEALKRISNRAYGVLVSIEPAVAALVGALLLGERIGMQGIIAVTCVVIAAIGITLTDE